jgi:hypothetical protein
VFATGQGHTTDPADAHRVALAALRAKGCGSGLASYMVNSPALDQTSPNSGHVTEDPIAGAGCPLGVVSALNARQGGGADRKPFGRDRLGTPLAHAVGTSVEAVHGGVQVCEVPECRVPHGCELRPFKGDRGALGVVLVISVG